ncbi:MAG TPA: helix-turn-helix domain-containing protein [Thermoanaerobaculia bacterium]
MATPDRRTTPPSAIRPEPRDAGERLLETMEKSLDTVRHVFGGSHRYYADALDHYARALHALGDTDRASEASVRAAAIRSSAQNSVIAPAPRPAEARVLDAQGAARYLSLGLDTLYRLVRSGELPHSRVGKSIRFRPEDLDEYIAARVTREWTRVDKRGRPKKTTPS